MPNYKGANLTLSYPLYGDIGYSKLGYVNAETLSWVNRVISAGSTVSALSANAHDAFITAAKNGGFWSSIFRLNTYGANDLTGALVPLVNTAGGALDVNHNFVAGDFSLSAGLTGDGATKYLDTETIPSFPSGHLSSCVFTGSTSLFATLIGQFSTPNICALVSSSSSQNYYGIVSSPVVSTVPDGFLLISGDGSTGSVYHNGTLNASGATGSMSGASSLTIFARNDSPPASTFIDATMGSYSMGESLTQAQITAYYSALTTLMTALGRTIPV